ncbi:hypothetical protein AAMO2058_000261500 [Amorphochlora amoebiformis]
MNPRDYRQDIFSLSLSDSPMPDCKSPTSLLREENRKLRDENSELKAELKAVKSHDYSTFPNFTTRLLTAVAAILIYNIVWNLEGWVARISTFCLLMALAQFLGLPFAPPLNIPSSRRLQTAATIISFPPLLILACLTSYILLLWWNWGNYWIQVPLILYAIWINIDKSPSQGGYNRVKKWFRKLHLHKISASYYPCSLIRFDELFPGIDLTLMTLNLTFKVPFFREWIMAHGIASCGQSSCIDILNPTKKGKAIMLVIGGAAESLDARPDCMELTILTRKGFVRVALASGACLVPIISFGENELFGGIPNKRGSIVRKVQNWLQKKLGVAPVVFIGRGVFNYAFGVLPHRRAITSVVGSPIQCPYTPDVKKGDAIVDEYHKKYVDALRKLFEDQKEKYAVNGSKLQLRMF